MKRLAKTSGTKIYADSVTNRSQLLQLFEKDYAHLRWAWFGTLKFDRRDIPLWIAERAFSSWITRVDSGEGNFRCVRVAEWGGTLENLRYHVCVGGLRNLSKYPWMAYWKELVAGEADLLYSFTNKGPLHYLATTILPTSKVKIDFTIL